MDSSNKQSRHLYFPPLLMVLFSALLTASSLQAASNRVSININNGQRCIVANGIPNHSIGRFPNSGNPHSIRSQSINLCVPTNPGKNAQPRPARGSVGVAINGVQFRPGTADYYDASSRRGFSRNRSSGWNLEGMGARDKLGLDFNNAHVDERGLYHYHGVPKNLVRSAKSSLIGWAGDGFEIHYVGRKQRPSYRLKSGYRSSGPGGRYDGTYNEDWKYVEGSGTLDRCNGGMLNGKFVYYATDDYPFYPRCLWGNISRDFFGPGQQGGRGGFGGPNGGMMGSPGGMMGGPGNRMGGPNGMMGGPGGGMGGPQGGNRGFGGPPPGALSSCSGRSQGSGCSFSDRGRTISGSCKRVRNGQMACVPRGHRPPR